MGEGGLWMQWGVERLTEKAERLLKLIERMSTGGRAGGESRASSMRGCVWESVCESVAECPNIFSPHSINVFAGLSVWPGLVLSGGGWGGSGGCLTNQQHIWERATCRRKEIIMNWQSKIWLQLMIFCLFLWLIDHFLSNQRSKPKNIQSMAATNYYCHYQFTSPLLYWLMDKLFDPHMSQRSSCHIQMSFFWWTSSQKTDYIQFNIIEDEEKQEKNRHYIHE